MIGTFTFVNSLRGAMAVYKRNATIKGWGFGRPEKRRSLQWQSILSVSKQHTRHRTSLLSVLGSESGMRLLVLTTLLTSLSESHFTTSSGTSSPDNYKLVSILPILQEYSSWLLVCMLKLNVKVFGYSVAVLFVVVHLSCKYLFKRLCTGGAKINQSSRYTALGDPVYPSTPSTSRT